MITDKVFQMERAKNRTCERLSALMMIAALVFGQGCKKEPATETDASATASAQSVSEPEQRGTPASSIIKRELGGLRLGMDLQDAKKIIPDLHGDDYAAFLTAPGNWNAFDDMGKLKHVLSATAYTSPNPFSVYSAEREITDNSFVSGLAIVVYHGKVFGIRTTYMIKPSMNVIVDQMRSKYGAPANVMETEGGAYAYWEDDNSSISAASYLNSRGIYLLNKGVLRDAVNAVGQNQQKTDDAAGRKLGL